MSLETIDLQISALSASYDSGDRDPAAVLEKLQKRAEGHGLRG